MEDLRKDGGGGGTKEISRLFWPPALNRTRGPQELGTSCSLRLEAQAQSEQVSQEFGRSV